MSASHTLSQTQFCVLIDTIAELAAREGIAPTYVTRVVQLTLLAPEIVEGILQGRTDLGLAELLKPLPVEWVRQRHDFDRPM
jgi:hypothetical protein